MPQKKKILLKKISRTDDEQIWRKKKQIKTKMSSDDLLNQLALSVLPENWKPFWKAMTNHRRKSNSQQRTPSSPAAFLSLIPMLAKTCLAQQQQKKSTDGECWQTILQSTCHYDPCEDENKPTAVASSGNRRQHRSRDQCKKKQSCLLYTSDAADE